MPFPETDIEYIREYYKNILSKHSGLKTNSCRCTEQIPPSHQSILDNIDAEITETFYGCGSPIPPAVGGCTVLDLGCGSGRDVYLTSCLVGPKGLVIGVDMTDEPLALARAHQRSQAERFGFSKSNVDFRKGYIEDLAALGIADDSVDVVISNCVINLSPARQRVFAEIFRVLKPGGELFFSDVFASRRLPASVQEDRLLVAECLGGAIYIEDFRRMLHGLGCPDYRVMTKTRIDIGNPELEAKLGATTFWSMTIRAFKIASLEDLCEDYGQVASYLGSIPDHPHRFSVDDHHMFVTGKPMLVCGNTASMIGETRFAPHFKLSGDRSVHFGAFDCAAPSPVAAGGRGCR